ncbi:MAG: AAA family ATPase [bacterium]|nr:AAA family ATPase [bacterium]
MITRIYADNFRCLGNFEFRPNQLNLLLGDNGSGKTSLFEVLQLVKDLVIGGSSAVSLFPPHKKTIWDKRPTQSFELEIEGLGGTFGYRLEIQHLPQEAQKPQIKGESLDFGGKPLFRYSGGQVHLFEEDHSPSSVFPFKPEQSFLPNLESQNSRLQWFKGFVAGINVFQLNPFALDPFSQQDERFLNINGSNFPSWLRYLSEENPEAKLECEKRLADIFPSFQRFKFHPAFERKALLAEFMKDSGETYQLFFNNLSEGQRILSILYAVLYGLIGSASVLCFDEPENFISLQEVQPWLQSLRDLVEERAGQAFVISHHPEVIDYLASYSAFRFERPSGDLVRASAWIPDPERIMKPSEILVRGG